jgi:hypothetical protein
MQEVYFNQANEVALVMVAKDGTPITTGTVNFYLKDKDGSNAGKWYRGSDTSWQAAVSIAGAATHDEDGHWKLSLPTAVWEYGTRYRLIGKESGDLHIPVGDDLVVKALDLDRILKAYCSGEWRLKDGETAVYEILDADDGVTVVLEVELSQTTPFRTVTVKI